MMSNKKSEDLNAKSHHNSAQIEAVISPIKYKWQAISKPQDKEHETRDNNTVLLHQRGTTVSPK